MVLDFWATWCGPCMQSLPLVEEVVKEFTGQDVRLFAVNMEEQPDQIKAVLERHKMKFPVVLDRDGAVAARYAVTAIPQTVLIDRDGKIARLFVGGGTAKLSWSELGVEVDPDELARAGSADLAALEGKILRELLTANDR